MKRASVPAGSRLQQKHYLQEKHFILDCVAVSSMASVYETVHPKLWAVIPPYNGQKDNHTRQYYSSPSVKLLLEKTGQGGGGTSIHGEMVDFFYKLGPGQQALDRRNMAGAGHSDEQVTGHTGLTLVQQNNFGYNGKLGYRRNTPFLRQRAPCFGAVTKLPM
ncbi:uncharacterized protein C17orf98-like [Polyodon spathula]|uniref:uncharacterized protein C17orf98-like n=1 Tax=Polyodon spathula TaxID=7913 RepID=UPI001B7DEFA9|nr:uncharacterized protein C17orf98-like [Polyodon spathula]